MSSRVFAVFLTAFSLIAVACASREPSRPQSPADPLPSASTSQAGPQAGSAHEGSTAVSDPTDGEEVREWRVDEQGRQYYLEPFPKTLPYRETSEGRVKLAWGIEVEVADEDEEHIYFRVYRVDHLEPQPPGTSAPTPEDLEAVAATYRFETPSADRLRFEPFNEGLPTGGMWRNGFEIADIDGDGFLDIVHGPLRRGLDVPIIYRGDGQGGWSQWMEPLFPRGLLDYGDVAVADFSGNGLQDLAVASHFRGIMVFAQEEPGRFVPWSEGIDYALPGEARNTPVFSSRRIVAADWNGNGRPDIVALDEGPRVGPGARGGRGGAAHIEMVMFGPVIYLNNGDGTWGRLGGEEPSRFEIFGDDLAVADFNGNGRLDFLTSTNMMTRQDLLNFSTEDGTWQPAHLDVRPMAYVRSVAAGDFDGDGRMDAVLSYISFEAGVWRHGLDLFLNREAGWERHTLYNREGRNAFTALEAGDLTGDGRLDLVAADMDGNALVLLGDGAGGFTIEEAPELHQPFGACRAYQVRLADLDGSGRDEIVIAYADETSPTASRLPGALRRPEETTRCPTLGGIMAWAAEPRPDRGGRRR
jgi:hypothetical protein